VEERVKKAMVVMGQVWSIEKRRFGRDWERRMKLFDWLVGSVVGFRADMGVDGMGKSRKAARKVYKMGIKSRRENAWVYGKGGGKEG